MTSSPSPQAFDYIRPDEVAECWDGVLAVPQLYEALWAAMSNLPALNTLIDIEDSSPHDALGLNSVASVWHLFTPEHQAALIELEVLNG